MYSQVALVKCNDYEQARVDRAVRRGLELIGGIKPYINAGAKVLLKPNLLSPHTPEHGITTHPAVVRAVVRLVKEAGAVPIIGDSPAGAIKGIEHHWTKTGMKQLAVEEDVKLVSFETQPVETFQLQDRKYISTLHISKAVLEADVVINMPKLKTHGLTLFTGAIKNLFGCVPGLLKSEYHKQAPHPDDLAQMLVDLLSVVKPGLTVMDAIVGMEGNGPSRGPLINIGAVLISPDCVALDVVASRILGYKPLDITTTRLAAKQGLGQGHLKDIQILGDELNEVIQPDTLHPSNAILRKIPRFLLRFILNKFLWSKPVVNQALCTQCQLCVKSCPVQAMTLTADLIKIDDKVCINCLCCNEVCPAGAVGIKTSWLLRRSSRGEKGALVDAQ